MGRCADEIGYLDCKNGGCSVHREIASRDAFYLGCASAGSWRSLLEISFVNSTHVGGPKELTQARQVHLPVCRPPTRLPFQESEFRRPNMCLLRMEENA